MNLQHLCATVALLLSSLPASALTWQPLEVQDGQPMTWRKICTDTGPSGTWVKVTGCPKEFVFTQSISSNVQNYDLKQAAIAAGWNQSTPINATVTINSGVVVGSSSTTLPAFSTGTGFPQGSSLALINNGTIAGKGGAGGNGVGYSTLCGTSYSATPGGSGGPALEASSTLTVFNYGVIGGGGGGGGAGATAALAARTRQCGSPDVGFAYSGGGGGGGGAGGGNGGLGAITPGLASNGTVQGSVCFGIGNQIAGFNGLVGGYALPNNGGASGGPAATTCGQVTGGAGGTGGTLGATGTPGQAGTNAANQTSGGAPGAAVVGNNNVTWKSQGTVLGPIQ